MTQWYLYVSKETLTVTRVSPALEETDEHHIVQIDQELGISFIDQPHTLNDYVIYHDGTVTHFVKKDKSKEVLVPFFYSPAMIKEGVDNADIIVYIKNNEEMRVGLRPELINYAMSIYGNLPEDKRDVEFYISAKNDPNKLLEVKYIDMMVLIKGGLILTSFDYDANDVSIFTRKVFDSYGLQIIP